jgi:hypothetical protein
MDIYQITVNESYFHKKLILIHNESLKKSVFNKNQSNPI